MTAGPTDAVFDCNVFLQALGNPVGPAGRCVQAFLDGRARLFVDRLLLDELADVTGRPKVARKLRILQTRVDELTNQLMASAVLVEPVPQVFVYDRDPDDAHLVDLAIATGALLIVSRDKDLLDLMDIGNDTGRVLRAAHPTFRVVTPPGFLHLIDVRPDGG